MIRRLLAWLRSLRFGRDRMLIRHSGSQWPKVNSRTDKY